MMAAYLGGIHAFFVWASEFETQPAVVEESYLISLQTVLGPYDLRVLIPHDHRV